ncbi:hypothetical protein BGZ49_005050 [Haplosporangium sp. Z 27]|nr:hypothetical protein BGZ49_005050 [Haplosporangium sp. Z 27]
MDEVLGIPELRLTIVQFLDMTDLLSCNTLSKEWNNTCTPLIWHTILLSASMKSTKLPSLSAITKHGHHIRVLSLENVIGIEPLLSHCTHLTVLKLPGFDTDDLEDEAAEEDEDKVEIFSNELIQLVERNKASLKVFENSWPDPQLSTEALCTILSCPKLESLLTTGVTYDDRTWELLGNACTSGGGGRLERFVSVADTFSLEKLGSNDNDDNNDNNNNSMRWDNLTKLSFQYPIVSDEPQFVIECVRKCPQLEFFSWDTRIPFPTDDFVKTALPSCPKLDSISIQDVAIKDSDSSQILDAMNQLRLIRIRGLYGVPDEGDNNNSNSDGVITGGNNAPGSLTFTALRKHFSTLESIYFRSSYHIGSLNVQEILASCPNLRIIEASQLAVIDVSNGKPWVCTGLRVFRIGVVGTNKSSSGNNETTTMATRASTKWSVVFQQLSRLKQLKELDISEAEGMRSVCGGGPQLTLSSGLEVLADLKQLQYICTKFIIQQLAVKDVDWILGNWTKLKVWQGLVIDDEDGAKALKRRLVKAGILCIAFPIAYGEDRISALTLGVVLGLYFALWIAFSIVVRYLVPSLSVEPTLPIYTHSPPVPKVLHSPNSADAQPLSPAIRIHPSSLKTLLPPPPNTATTIKTNNDNNKKLEGEELINSNNNVSNNTDKVIPSSYNKGPRATRFADLEESPAPTQQEQHRHRNVTFQTRPRAGTTDSTTSTNSTVFPTFAAYRQSQQSNRGIDAFALRVKKAFAISQQQKEQARIQEILRRQQLEEEEEERRLQEEERMQLQQLEQQQQQAEQQQQDGNMFSRRTRFRSASSALPLSSLPSFSNVPKPTTASTGNRSRSASAASMFSDIAERIKNGSLFKRPPSYTSSNFVATPAMEVVHVDGEENRDDDNDDTDFDIISDSLRR